MSARLLLSLQAFAAVYILYGLTAYPGVPGGDSGELLAEACLLGTPHPPGYPLYTMLCAVARSLLAGLPRLYLDCSEPVWQLRVDHTPTHAWTINNLCALLGSAAAALIAVTCYDILCVLGGEGRPRGLSAASLAGTMLFALSPLVWEYSITAEVFALNNLLCAALCYLTTKVYVSSRVLHDADSTSRHLYLGALASGMCMANQHSSLLLLTVLVPCALFFAYPHSARPTTLAAAALSFLVGMSPYAYLVAAARNPRPGSWGDASSLRGLLRHVLREEYGTFQLGTRAGSEGFAQRVVLYLQHASQETYHLVFPLAAAGLLCSLAAWQGETAARSPGRRRQQGLPRGAKAAAKEEPPAAGKGGAALALAAAWLFYTLVWHGVLSNLPLDSPMPYGVHARFWMQPHVPLSILAGVGVSTAGAFVNRLLLPRVAAAGGAELLLVAALLAAAVQRLPAMAKGSGAAGAGGGVMHRYAAAALASLPPRSLLLAHTDLDWNPVRYLRHCEGLRPDVTHLSFQLMPYPWFRTQQEPLYPHIRFPDAGFRGVSTDRASEGNAQLVGRFLAANGVLDGGVLDSIAGGVYLDMQAVNEVEIGAFGRWRGFVLQPWGTLYKVLGGALASDEHAATLHASSYEQLLRLQEAFPQVDAAFIAMFPAGTWEFAAASVYYDAHYQLGLSLLTYSIEAQKTASIASLPVVFDRLHAAAHMLRGSLRAALAFRTISSPIADLHKNTALAYMRLQGLLSVCSKFRSEIIAVLQTQEPSVGWLAAGSFESLTAEESAIDLLRDAVEVLEGFLAAYPGDGDRDAFERVAVAARNALRGLG